MNDKLLVVVDMQNDFIDGELGSKRALDIVDRVVEKIKNWDGSIIVTMDSHESDSYDTTEEGKTIPEHCIYGSKGWRLNSKVNEALEAKGDYYICQKIDRFATPEIGSYASTNQKDYVEFVGLCTDICVVSNVLMLRSMNPTIDIAVDSTCCAGLTERSHEAALMVMENCCVDILR